MIAKSLIAESINQTIMISKKSIFLLFGCKIFYIHAYKHISLEGIAKVNLQYVNDTVNPLVVKIRQPTAFVDMLWVISTQSMSMKAAC